MWHWIHRWQFDWHIGLHLTPSNDNESEQIMGNSQVHDADSEIAVVSSSVSQATTQSILQERMLQESPLEDKKVNQQQKRVKSLDAFRGLSITIMIFVNYGGGGYW